MHIGNIGLAPAYPDGAVDSVPPLVTGAGAAGGRAAGGAVKLVHDQVCRACSRLISF